MGINHRFSTSHKVMPVGFWHGTKVPWKC